MLINKIEVLNECFQMLGHTYSLIWMLIRSSTPLTLEQGLLHICRSVFGFIRFGTAVLYIQPQLFRFAATQATDES